MRYGGVAIALSLIALAGCDRDPHDALAGTLERDRVELVSEAAEPILSIDVREGDRLAAGARVLRQDDTAAQARLAAAQAVESEARQRLDELIAGPRREEILAAGAAQDAAGARARVAAQELVRAESLVEKQLVSAAELDRRRAERDAAAAEERRAAAALKLLLRGTRAEQVEQARAAVTAASARSRELAIAVARLDVRAPVAALVDDLPYEAGERPPPGATVAVLLAAGAPWARIYVPEPLRAAVGIGTPATLRLDGVEREYKGRVRRIASEAAFTPYYALTQRERARLAFLTEVELIEADAAALPTGVPVQVRLATRAP